MRRGTPFIRAKARRPKAMISSMEAGRGEGRQNRYREKKRPADKRFVIEPPRLYSRQGIFSQPPSGGAIRHWPPVPGQGQPFKR